MNERLDTHPTKLKYSNPRMNRWKSWRGNTMFAPNFDVSIYTDNCEKDLAKNIVDLIKENDVGMSSDVANSLNTTYQMQWSMYNIFSWENKEIKTLAEKIYSMYFLYMQTLNATPLEKDKLWIRGWAVVLSENESLGQHCHAFHENTYLSGNISLSDLNTTTDYWFPYLSLYFDYWRSQNTMGSMTLFPSWLEHKVDSNTTGTNRYSIGFDLFTEHSFNYIRENRNEGSEIQDVILLSKKFSDL